MDMLASQGQKQNNSTYYTNDNSCIDIDICIGVKVAATAVAAAVTTVAAAAASSHSSARRRFKATGISGTQHAVSIAAGAALAANDHSADSDRSVTGLMTQMASASTLGATSRTPQPTLVAKVANQNQLYLLRPFEDLHCLFNTTNPIWMTMIIV
ncbi:hypothetical protein BASA61_000679 [Batrachochytrium salamandrivorans]|nr:hypothetical protein BASA61_000679 [Batrachochytrium salamandrivorans]